MGKNDHRPINEKMKDKKYEDAYKKYATHLHTKGTSKGLMLSKSRATAPRNERIVGEDAYKLRYLNFVDSISKSMVRSVGLSDLKVPDSDRVVYRLEHLKPYLISSRCNVMEDSPAMFELSHYILNPYTIFDGKRDKKILTFDYLNVKRNLRDLSDVKGCRYPVDDRKMVDSEAYQLFLSDIARDSISFIHLNDMVYDDENFLYRLMLYGTALTYRSNLGHQKSPKYLSVISHKNVGDSVESFYKSIDINVWTEIPLHIDIDKADKRRLLNMLRGADVRDAHNEALIAKSLAHNQVPVTPDQTPVSPMITVTATKQPNPDDRLRQYLHYDVKMYEANEKPKEGEFIYLRSQDIVTQIIEIATKVKKIYFNEPSNTTAPQRARRRQKGVSINAKNVEFDKVVFSNDGSRYVQLRDLFFNYNHSYAYILRGLTNKGYDINYNPEFAEVTDDRFKHYEKLKITSNNNGRNEGTETGTILKELTPQASPTPITPIPYADEVNEAGPSTPGTDVGSGLDNDTLIATFDSFFSIKSVKSFGEVGNGGRLFVFSF